MPDHVINLSKYIPKESDMNNKIVIIFIKLKSFGTDCYLKDICN